ncbi:MAG: hypothetical protein MJZ33_07635 [Paludibacteraceae bacterium]|nr:hypothetical protein [Paludibacteraceae bacterium]
MEVFTASYLNSVADRLKACAEIYDMSVYEADNNFVEDVAEDIVESENNNVKNAFDTPIGDKKDTTIKQLMSASAIIAQKKGEKISIKTTNPLGVASFVDECYTRAKLAYQIGCGKLRAVHEAVDIAIEKTATRVITAAEIATKKIVAKGVEVAYDGINALVYAVYPPAGNVMKGVRSSIVKPLGSWLGNKCAKYVRSGLTKVKNCVKEKAHEVVEKGGRLWDKAKAWIKSKIS